MHSSHHYPRYIRHLIRDLLIVVGSIVVAVWLVRADLIHFAPANFVAGALYSLLAGALFTSVFTVAPSAVGLVSLAQSMPPLLVALLGAVGATTIDLIIVSFVRKEIASDLDNLKRLALRRHFLESFHFGFLKWVALLTGVFLVATPLPDEIGLFLIGVSRIKARSLPLLFFCAHFGGILLLITAVGAVVN